MHDSGAIVLAAIISGSIYALIAVGFAIAFRISAVFNLAHGALLVLSGYANFWLAQRVGLPFPVTAIIAVCLVTLFGTLIEGILIPAAKSNGLSPVDLLILSWLLLVVLQDGVAATFNNQSIYLAIARVQPGFPLFGARITTIQFCSIVASLFVAVVLTAFMRRFWGGRAVTAAGDNMRLARIYGLNVKRIVILNALLASAATASAGVLLSYQERVDPTLAFRFSLIGIVSTLIGLRLGPAGAVFGAYAIAALETFVLYFVDARLRDTAVYVCLAAVVLHSVRPGERGANWPWQRYGNG